MKKIILAVSFVLATLAFCLIGCGENHHPGYGPRHPGFRPPPIHRPMPGPMMPAPRMGPRPPMPRH